MSDSEMDITDKVPCQCLHKTEELDGRGAPLALRRVFIIIRNITLTSVHRN